MDDPGNLGNRLFNIREGFRKITDNSSKEGRGTNDLSASIFNLSFLFQARLNIALTLIYCRIRLLLGLLSPFEKDNLEQ